MIRVSDFIASYIYDELGVKDIFMVSGAGVMHLTDGVAKHGKLNPICVHHEQTTSMAIDAYSRACKNFAVGYFTTGPGGTNAITGLAGAWQDSVPCLFISGQVKKKEASYTTGIKRLRQFGVQELNIIPIVESVCKCAVFLDDPTRVRYEIERLVHIAKSGRPGPVWIDIPMDVQAALIDPDGLEGYTQENENNQISVDSIEEVVALLKDAKRPVIIAGHGVRLAGASNDLAQLVADNEIPVVTPYLGIDNLKHSQKEYIGKIGIKGDRAGNYAMQNSDLVICIGTSLHVAVIGYDYHLFARGAKKVVIDIDEIAHKKETISIDKLLICDAKDFICTLKDKLVENEGSSCKDWLELCNSWKQKYKVCQPEYEDTKGAINIYSFIDQLSKQSGEGDIFISDAGSAYYATSQGIKLTKDDQRYITSGAMATMGFSLPAAIGAAVACKDKRVLAITGDGSLQMNIQEIQTLVHYGLNVKLFVLNNDGYLSIRASQKNYFENRFIGESDISGVSFPDILKLAEAYGIKAVRVSDIKKLEETIYQVLKTDGPIICDVITPREQPIVPTVSSVVNEDGTMSSRPLEDMAPFLDREEYKKNLLIDEVE